MKPQHGIAPVIWPITAASANSAEMAQFATYNDNNYRAKSTEDGEANNSSERPISGDH